MGLIILRFPTELSTALLASDSSSILLITYLFVLLLEKKKSQYRPIRTKVFYWLTFDMFLPRHRIVESGCIDGALLGGKEEAIF